MQKMDYFGRMRRPTMEQIRYVEELMERPKRGTAARIAENHEVSAALVSRFFRDFRNAGYLTEDRELTEDGKTWLGYYKGLEERLTQYMKNIGVPEASVAEHVRIMEEQMEDHVIASILEQASGQGCGSGKNEETITEAEACYAYLKSRMEKGEYRIDFSLLRYASNKKWEQTLSMADRGFEKPAILVCDEDHAWLELTPCEIAAESRINNNMMHGHLSSLSYIANGTLTKVEFMDDGKVRIPLEVCTFHMLTEGRLNGFLPITVTCSVGLVHMPESTALLVFWV